MADAPVPVNQATPPSSDDTEPADDPAAVFMRSLLPTESSVRRRAFSSLMRAVTNEGSPR